MATLFALTLSGSALALLLFALRFLFRKRLPNTVYYYAWLLVLLRFALPLPGLIRTGSPDETKTLETGPVISAELPMAGEDGFILQTAPVIMAPEEKPAVIVTQKENEIPVSVQTVPAGKSVRSIEWKSPVLWLAVWASGAAVCFAVTVISYSRFSIHLCGTLQKPDLFTRALYASIPGRKPLLYISTAVKTPMMCGVIHPRIILPAQCEDEELLRNVLQHELMHYRRRDTLYKWFSVAILSSQWFNPLSWLIRREIDRSCELSCDEMLLRSMDRERKQSYGNTLLRMAASASLPAGVVATTFSTEKKNLKERLEQIMHYKKGKTRTLAAVLALVLLAGCGAVAGPAAKPEETGSAPENTEMIRVATVDELLAAIAPDRVIELAAGTYDLSTASDYAGASSNPYYAWNEVYASDGEGTCAELELKNLYNFTLTGEGMEKTVISAVPRYANVIRFSNCRDLNVSNLTAGHTKEPGFCAGGVLYFAGCAGAQVDRCGLFGCGTVGVSAFDTRDLAVTGSDIYECSFGAVELVSCRTVRVEDCEIHDHGKRPGQGSAMFLFSVYDSNGLTIVNNRIRDNSVQNLLTCGRTKDTLFLSNEVRNNDVVTSMFTFEQFGAVVDGCAFTENDNRGNRWYNSTGIFAYDAEGNELDAEALSSMTLRQIDPASIRPAQSIKPMTEVAPGGSVEVTTVDEFLAAIGPDRTIVLRGKEFDLSTAENYGGISGEYYYWSQAFDGPELVIHDLGGLTIQGNAEDPSGVAVSAVPRYANVLNFTNCTNIQLFDFTAGHTKEPGECAGGVLHLDFCSDFRTDNMRLYGCGVLGLQTANCSSLDIRRTEIYECSQGAAHFFQTDGIVFTDCDIHDVPSPMLVFNECGDKIWNETPISGLSGEYDVDESGALTGSSRGYLPYETVFAEEERPTGAGSLQPFGIQISFFDVVLTGDFTMRMKADSDIMLHATASDGSTSGFIWSVDREGVLELTPSEDGSECRIHQIGEYPEGVWITVEKDGMVQSVCCHAMP
ncbi:MAG: right-handed parallel beta-helix repeat-containing protein [Oscillospiraceae bacterium]|nr:right-handed parallel beta-helix repeat-containing protein [Oscillospiraceae bacterium]